MIKKLLLVTFIFLSVNVFAQAPVLTNFRILDNEPSKVYFDADKDITGLTKKGFIISGKSISSVDTSGKFFTVSTPFSFWDNNTIRLENGDGTVFNFTLSYIENKIAEPDASKNTYYVSLSGDDKNKGTSEGQAWRTINKAAKTAKEGSTVWIKAGNYRNQYISKATGGKASSPIKFIGYKSTPGDIESMYYNYGDGSLDPTQMPLFNGGDRTSGIFCDLKNKNYNIWKNVQFTGYAGIFRSSSMDGFIGDNILIKDIGHGTSNGDAGASAKNGNGVGFKFQSPKDMANKIRLSNCTVINASKEAYVLEGNHNMLISCKAYCDEVDLSNFGGITTDYYYLIEGSNTIIKDCLAYRNTLNGKGHPGHGISIKSATHLPTEYNLVDNNTVINCTWGIQARWMHVRFNVYKNNLSHADVVNRGTGGGGQVGFIIKDGADYNIFENNIIRDTDKGFQFEYGKEDPTANHAGSHNIIRNNLLYNLKGNIINFSGGTNTGNKIYNNTFYKIAGSTFSGSGTYSNCEFKNNILHTVGKSKSYTGWTLDTNDFYNSTPQGTNASKYDPKFDANFVPTNEALKAGIPLSKVKYDKNNNVRSKTVPTMGAIEMENNSTGSVSPDISICTGESTILTAYEGTSYTWSTGETTASISVSPIETATYTVTVSDVVNSDSHNVTVTINQLPSVDAGADIVICSGEEVTLTATGNGNFLWSTGETTDSITVSPTETSTYTVTAGNDVCTTTIEDEIIVTVNPNSNLNAGDDVTICSGESITLTASSNSDFLWSTGETTASISVNPTITSIYTVTSTSGDCSISDEVVVNVNDLPSVSLGEDSTICSGESIELKAEGNGNFLWSTGETSSSIIINPTISTTYTVTASSSCSDPVTDEIVVNVTPAITLDAGNDVTICSGESITLTAFSNSALLWSTGETTASILVNPSTNTTYAVTSSSGDCSLTDEVVVTVNNLPSVSLGEDTTICSGESIELKAEGNGNFLWSTGETSSSIIINPTVSSSYTVTASTSCSEPVSDSIIVTVSDLPVVEAGSDVTIKNGSSTVLVANGEGKFLWSTGETSSSVTVNPTSTTTYTVILTSLEGCSSQDNITVNVSDNLTPTVNVDAVPDQNICLDESVTLIATGGSNYLWSTGETTASISVSPTETTIYAVTISNGSTVDVDDITIFVDETCSGIGNRSINKESKLYPNPTQGELNIELAGFNEQSNISVFDLNGRLVYSEIINNYSPIKILKRQLNLSRFGKGIYFVRLINNDTSETKKVLVI